MSVDTELLVQSLRKRGHAVDGVIKVPDNAGDYEFIVDGTLTLEEARALLEHDQETDRRPAATPKPRYDVAQSTLRTYLHRNDKPSQPRGFCHALYEALLLLEGQRGRVDAVTLAGGIGAVGKDMAKVRAAGGARGFDAAHAVAIVFVQFYCVRRNGLEEAGPPGTGLELCIRLEQRSIAGGTVIHAVGMIVDSAPVKARSVPVSRRMWYCSGVSRLRHSASSNCIFIGFWAAAASSDVWPSSAIAASLSGPAGGMSGMGAPPLVVRAGWGGARLPDTARVELWFEVRTMCPEEVFPESGPGPAQLRT